jgi:hypothetical protein
MKKWIICFVLICVLGCGKEKTDNLDIQTPNDQPIGSPKSPNGEYPGLISAAKDDKSESGKNSANLPLLKTK